RAGAPRGGGHRRGAGGKGAQAGMPPVGPAVGLAGSGSVMTNSQVAAYRQQAPARAVDLSACFTDPEAYWPFFTIGPAAPFVLRVA
ncbi:hypothetical protein M8371_32815, partial [Klebsiella pneumoniae]|nr:hypothetical protein [Klebsiella pneumoniae]